MYSSSKDVEVRRKALDILRARFSNVAKLILEGVPPVLEIRKRTLANTLYDIERGVLRIGSETLRRAFLDAGEAKKFMQTVLMASIICDALINNEYPTIRDLFYRGKHTIRYRKLPSGRVAEENTWNEQYESDSVIRDIEVFIDMLREEMLILSKEKGKVVGDMRIRSGDDVIDLSRMGHGAYAIESTPDLIEFIDVNADFVLVIEKDAVFQQLHRAGFWRRHKAILITSAGQPDRATRRFVRRLNEELNLPVYVLTDSIPRDEVVIIRDPLRGIIRVGPIEDLIGKYFTGNVEKERVIIPLQVGSWDPRSGKIRWFNLGYAYRHAINDELVEVETRSRGVIRVTKGHSLFVLRKNEVVAIPAFEVKAGDRIIVASNMEGLGRHDYRGSGGDGLSEEAAWLLGLITSKVALNNSNSTRGEAHNHGSTAVGTASNTVDELTSINCSGFTEYVKPLKPHILYDILKDKELCTEVLNGDVPSRVFNSSVKARLAYINGLIHGGLIRDDRDGLVCKVRSRVLAKQLALLMLTAGMRPVVKEGDGLIVLKGWGVMGVQDGGVGDEDKPGLSRDSKHLSGGYSSEGFKSLSDITVDEVVGVKRKRYIGYVYDLAVPETQSFIGGYGIVYHNSDPYGWYIYSVFKIGSITLSYESERLATPSAKFIGVCITDVFGDDVVRKRVKKLKSLPKALCDKVLSLPRKKPYLSSIERRNYIIRAKPKDVERAIELVGYDVAEACLRNRDVKSKLRKRKEVAGYPWFRTPEWVREMCVFFHELAKLEIEALTSKGLRFLMDSYIPEKISSGDWIS